MGVQLSPVRCFHNVDDAAGFLVAAWPVQVGTGIWSNKRSTVFPVYVGNVAQDLGQLDTSSTAYVGMSYYDTSGNLLPVSYSPVEAQSCALPGASDLAGVSWLIGAALVAIAAREFVRKAF